jgi:tetratricopeptide (TPR) repeat protein
MLKQVIAVEPRFLLARKNLRIAQVKALLAKKPNAMTHQMASLKGTFTMMGAQGKLKKNPQAALEGAEKLLDIDPLNLPFLKFFAQAAEAADMPEIAVQTLEIAKPYFAKDVVFLRLLARLYIATNQPAGAKDCYAAVAELLPNDQVAIKNLKDAAALDTMKIGGWNDMKSDFRSKLKDKKEAILLEQQAKSVKGDADVDTLITERLKDIEREPQNMNFRRALADLYVRAERFDEALQALDDATKAAGRSDPQIERTASQIKVRSSMPPSPPPRPPATKPPPKPRKGKGRVPLRRRRRHGQALPERPAVPLRTRLPVLPAQAVQRGHRGVPARPAQPPAPHPRPLLSRPLLQPEGPARHRLRATPEGRLRTHPHGRDQEGRRLPDGLLADQMGRQDEAIAFFKEIYGVDIKYRDISQRIEAAYQKK